jgi:stage III sporulation protein AF
MEFIKEWVTNIILFVLFATMIDMLLPSSKFQKYTKMVTGLLLIAIILTPIFNLLTQDFEDTMTGISNLEISSGNQINNSIDLQKNEIQASQDAYILKQMAVQLKEDANEELMDQYGLAIINIDLVVDAENQQPFPENLKKVVLQLEQPKQTEEAVEVVKSVEISTQQPLPMQKENEDNDKVKQLLSKKWDVEEKVIELQIEGGARESNETR